jgi:6-phosphogluconolactonase
MPEPMPEAKAHTVYLGSNDGNIYLYDQSPATGGWTARGQVLAGANPSWLTVDAQKRFLVASQENSGSAVSYAITAGTGALTRVNQVNTAAGPVSVEFDKAGRFAVVAHYSAPGSVGVVGVAANGTLTAGVDTEPTGPMSHQAVFDPSGAFVFIPVLGTNQVAQFTFNAQTGALARNAVPNLAVTGNNPGPRHLAFHPTQPFAYLNNELNVTLMALGFNRTTGQLSILQTVPLLPAGTPAAGVTGSEIAVHPSGKWVFAATRHQATVGNNLIARYAIGADGMLTLADHTPTGGLVPRNFAISPDGFFLYAGNQNSNTVTGFRINQTTGALTSLGAPVVPAVTGPQVIVLVPK